MITFRTGDYKVRDVAPILIAKNIPTKKDYYLTGLFNSTNPGVLVTIPDCYNKPNDKLNRIRFYLTNKIGSDWPFECRYHNDHNLTKAVHLGIRFKLAESQTLALEILEKVISILEETPQNRTIITVD